MNSITPQTDTGCPAPTSLAIANRVERSRGAVLQAIRENLNDFEEFGLVVPPMPTMWSSAMRGSLAVVTW